MPFPDSKSTQASLNRAVPDHLADLLRTVRIGDVLAGHVPQQVRKAAPAADANQLATLESIALPKHMRATAILRAYARSTGASGTLGELAVQLANTTPADGQIAIAPNGDVVVLASADYSDIDVDYVPANGEVVELPELPVASNALTIPTPYVTRGVIYLLEAVATAGTSAGQKIITAPSASTASAGHARLDIAKATVKFNGTDAITKARVTLLVVPTTQLDDALLADAPTI